MNQENVRVPKTTQGVQITQTGLMLAMALVFQIFFARFMQPVVGPLVNMTLILSVLLVGKKAGLFVGSMTPIVAYTLGVMPMLPLIPLVVLGNITYVLLFDRWKGHNSYLAVLICSLGKFLVMAVGVRLLVPLFLEEVPPMIVTTFSLPQLYTALIGGGLALILHGKVYKKVARYP